MAVVEEAPAAPVPRPQGEVDYRLAQQRILAKFGMDALRSRDIDTLLDRAVELCAAGMNAGFCKYLDAPDEEGRMLVRAGLGWEPGLVGTADLGADLASPAGYAFKIGEPVISNHLDEEERFRTPDLMAEHGIKRAINVLVEADGKRYGVIEVDSVKEGKFDEDDLAFMQGFANLIGVAIERQETEAKLSAAIEYQELLTREASHRVKNSLAMVSSMLELQMREDDHWRIRRMLGDAQARITAIAQTHDQLWRGDKVGLVNLNDLACGLTETLAENASRHTILCHADAIVISADAAMPIGLVLTELLTNAIKYAYGDKGGEIVVDIVAKGGQLEMTVTDHGIGMPDASAPKASTRTSLGTRMITSLTRQLRGTITYEDAAPGTRARLTMPDPREGSTAQ